MTDRLVDATWFQHHEQWLRYTSHAQAAWEAAHSRTTPVSLVQGLLERHARFTIRAQAAREAARALEPQ